MRKSTSREIVSYVVAISIGVFGGLTLWYWGSPFEIFPRDTQLNTTPSGTEPEIKALTTPLQEEFLLSYVRAVQKGNCDQIIKNTWWMQQRLQLLKDRDLDDQAYAESKQQLCSDATIYDPAAAQLSFEGIKDQYVFSPFSTIKVLGADKGRTGLSKSVSERIWIRIDYSREALSIRDEKGRPIKAITVGMNLSTDPYILKAGIRGNLDIDLGSISLKK